MYTTQNFRTKKQLKEAVANGNTVRIYQPGVMYQPGGMFNPAEADLHYTGTAVLEGPHFPAPHTWYAQVEMKDGVVVKVK